MAPTSTPPMGGTMKIPDVLPVIPLTDRVLLPGLLLRVNLESEAMLALLKHLRGTYSINTGGGHGRGFRGGSGSGSGNKDEKEQPLVLCVPIANPQYLKAASPIANSNSSSNDISSPTKKSTSPSGQVALVRRTGATSSASIGHRTADENMRDLFSPFENNTGNTGNNNQVIWHRIGCVARVVRIQRVLAPTITYTIILQGVSRARINQLTQREPFPMASQSLITLEPYKRGLKSLDEQVLVLQTTARKLLSFLKELQLPESTLQQLGRFITDAGDDPGELADMLAGTIDASHDDRLRVLSAVQLNERLALVTELLTRQIHSLSISQKIHSTVEGNLSKKQREFYLRQQLEAIKEELGEKDSDNDSGDSDINDLQARLDNANLPPDAQKAASRELKRLKRTPSASAEHQVIRTYLEWLTELPWQPNSVSAEQATADIDLAHARKQLNDDHHGLEQVKRRILEHLAVLRLRRDVHGPIICLVGPPGVGKTSLGRSIARALGRRFHRIALGGVRDEAEIRGHRRTYVGAMPGLIIQGMRKCGSSDPVFLLDEIDKVGQHSMHGDPSAALLEVLDPEQNHTFTDHYLNIPFDLSHSLFIATANRIDTIPAPLLDRMEVIELSGYTADEKLAIARRHLLPKQAVAHGFEPDQFQLTDDTLMRIIHGWTREAGVRNLEREIAAVCRRAAVLHADSATHAAATSTSTSTGTNHLPWSSNLSVEELVEILGPERFEDEMAARAGTPGLATGLAYTQSGSGGLLFVECSRMPGTGRLTLTGKLGEVIKESAHIALSWLRSNAHVLGLTDTAKEDLLHGIDVHIHCPAGAIPKDGPSAGVTLVTALYSLFSGHIAPTWLAMTGEVTLRGLVMPVGGIKEKLTAAHRAGCRRVLVPEGNKPQVVWEVPEQVRDQVHVTYVANVWDVLRIVFGDQAISSKQLLQGQMEVASRI